MFVYDLRLQQPTAITTAALGNFSGTKAQEIVTAKGSVLELLRPDTTTGRVVPVLTHEVFGVVRSLSAFRLTGSSKGNGFWSCVSWALVPDRAGFFFFLFFFVR